MKCWALVPKPRSFVPSLQCPHVWGPGWHRTTAPRFHLRESSFDYSDAGFVWWSATRETGFRKECHITNWAHVRRDQPVARRAVDASSLALFVVIMPLVFPTLWHANRPQT